MLNALDISVQHHKDALMSILKKIFFLHTGWDVPFALIRMKGTSLQDVKKFFDYSVSTRRHIPSGCGKKTFWPFANNKIFN